MRHPTLLSRTLIDCEETTARELPPLVSLPCTRRYLCEARLRHFLYRPLAGLFVSLIEKESSPACSRRDDCSIIGVSIRSHLHATTRRKEKKKIPGRAQKTWKFTVWVLGTEQFSGRLRATRLPMEVGIPQSYHYLR